jgi:class 3 adenylate cyclase
MLVKTQNTRAELNRLLQMRNDHPEQASDIDAMIREIFATTCAVMVMDMSGFSRLTARHGIIHFLAMIRRMCAIATPIIARHQGTLIKQEADNLFATFQDVPQALEASMDMLKAFSAVNTGLPDEQDIYGSMGIGYGEILVIENEDMYGSEMNLASKLGEDLARSGEILLTEEAYQRLPTTNKTWERLEFSISGLHLMAYRVPFSQLLL